VKHNLIVSLLPWLSPYRHYYYHPGVTKRLTWVRLGNNASSKRKEEELELLDSPGIIPAKQVSSSSSCCCCIREMHW